MPQQLSEPLNDPVINGLAVGVMLLSVTTWLFLISAWRRGPVLEYEPRRPVPWGPAATLLAVLFVLMALTSAVSGHALSKDIKPKPVETVENLAAFMLTEITITGSFLFAVAVFSRATPRDLGLPKNSNEAVRDAFIGVMACFAAAVPVFAVQAVLQKQPSRHELVKMLTEVEPNFLVMILGSVVAVVVAPVCEEIMFRVLLQGWLEKWEDQKLGWRDPPIEIAGAQLNTDAPPDAAQLSVASDASLEEAPAVQLIPCQPPATGLAGLPYGWVPIIISSIFFAAAHFGYGPEPVPLFFLALILGYVYQRTHRIVPCIVAHAVFNSLTMIVLWRTMYLSTGK
jgi:membrane protease YdiL (CAAX protease family)